jgi:hypothetical protein
MSLFAERPRPLSVHPGKSGSGHVDMTGDHENSTAAVLVPAPMLWKGMFTEVSIADCLFDHRAATFASGADVTGAPACSSGATRL